MKQTDIDRLKTICEKEGFQFDWDHVDHSAIIIREKKDPWEGVEFISGCLGVIYKVAKTDSDGIHTTCGKFTWWDTLKKNYIPSTESAYIDQLKKEAFERYGEIKDGDMFESATGGEHTVIEFERQKEWDYFKKFDQFFYKNVEIYCSGKWAKKLPERVKVRFEGASCKDHPVNNNTHDIHEYRFHVSSKLGLPWGDFGNYLAKCLEDYLNKEAGI